VPERHQRAHPALARLEHPGVDLRALVRVQHRVPRDVQPGVPDAELVEALVGEHVRLLVGDPDDRGRRGGARERERAEGGQERDHGAQHGRGR
jgi:hypothetical protein